MKNFTEKEFPEDLKYAHPKLLKNIDSLRDFMQVPIYPSPVPGALARFDIGADTSQHYAVKRLSTALDFFCNADPFEAWTKIIQSGLFPRVGIYFDTFYKNRKWVMFHGDLKNKGLLWFRHKKKYYYSTYPMFYHKLFKYLFLYRENRK